MWAAGDIDRTWGRPAREVRSSGEPPEAASKGCWGRAGLQSIARGSTDAKASRQVGAANTGQVERGGQES